MKNLSRILTIMLTFAPLYANAAGTVATTAGNNLTAFNPSNANNNQWATLSNGRYDASGSAKADFGNCNALILRCAQPKCANGGCSEMSVASAIVSGCVQSNSSCKQYGDDLVQYMSAQLVASSTAKVNEQNAAAANAAAQAAAQQSQQQMQQMQVQMQQMQQQMAEQQAQSQQQLQAALAQQAAQSQAAIESMKSAATEAAKQNEAGISAYQQDAINRGITTDVLERQKITGQIMTEIENAEVSLKEVKVAMNSAFEYAGCDERGNNCTGPKRVKKWRELATEFLTPYDNTIDKIYDALVIAQTVGVDLSQIYMMLNNSCNSWGQYMCPQMTKGDVTYTSSSKGQKGMPYVCRGKTDSKGNITKSGSEIYSEAMMKCQVLESQGVTGVSDCYNEALAHCQPCTLLKVLTDQNDVYEGWVNAEAGTNSSNTTVVACASSALDASALFARRTKNKNGAGLVDIDKLDTWLNQKEPNRKYKSSDIKPIDYCNADDNNGIEILEKSALGKQVPTKGAHLCVYGLGQNDKNRDDKEECAFISPVYAICDAHQYNAGAETLESEKTTDTQTRCNDECAVKTDALEKEACVNECKKYPKTSTAQMAEIKEIIGLKTTVISQQMYKQYEYLSATLRRLKTQLEKATLTATLEAAGAKSDDSSSGLLGASSKNSQYRDCSGRNMQGTLDCLRENYTALSAHVNSKKCDQSAQKQLENDISIMNSILGAGKVSGCPADKGKVENCKTCLQNYNGGMIQLDREISNDEARRNGRYRD